MATSPTSQPRADLRSPDGATVSSIELDPTYFGITPNVAVMHQVVTAQLAAARSGTQSTLTRAEVRGGGSKPWRQKGTGRARQGSSRAPHWAGGGIALGPKPRDYRQKTPKKMVALALRSALSDRAAEGRVAVVDEWAFETPSTKAAVAALGALGTTGKVLVVLRPEDDNALLSFRNLPEVRVLLAGELNAYDVLCSDWVVFTRQTLPGTAATGPAAQAAPGEAPAGEAPAGEPSAGGASSAAPAAGAPASGETTEAPATVAPEDEAEGDQA
ncbi:MAG TPA: 50S ribosomal protein L4 [Acidimicrobiales bacterium]|nr:50S ribosomal protein L4 [Acidimicrobiales bacterium]